MGSANSSENGELIFEHFCGRRCDQGQEVCMPLLKELLDVIGLELHLLYNIWYMLLFMLYNIWIYIYMGYISDTGYQIYLRFPWIYGACSLSHVAKPSVIIQGFFGWPWLRFWTISQNVTTWDSEHFWKPHHMVMYLKTDGTLHNITIFWGINGPRIFWYIKIYPIILVMVWGINIHSPAMTSGTFKGTWGFDRPITTELAG